MRRRSALLAAVLVVPLGLANPLAAGQAECAGLLDCSPRPPALVGDGVFKGSLGVELKGSGGEFETNLTMAGPLELEVAD